ncbi:hypothetical protein E3T24_05605 [Cryobacterium sp. TmT2-59]|uniref:hypothetical protein n=1 Tax=Cryobacterium sp. TmT2-59 TaxID=1259264 RepID=UPI00106BD661|nr:hypothetical protein [Cryobacterium sp. TmT2-59]TFC87186.1 hypothetical protein E3T24_05605 [Cryobacterium sp. TmT2-59]
MSEKFETRSVKETASETALISSLMLICLALLIFGLAGSDDGGARALEWTASAGKLLYGQLEWTLGVYITTLLAFYAVSIGGQVLGGTVEAANTRRVLGFIAELMAAATLALVAFVAVHCWQNPANWAVFIILLPVVGIILFLALQLGSFLVPDLEIRIALAESTRAQAREQLARVRRRSRRSFWLVFGVNAAAIGLGVFLLMLPVDVGDSAFLLWLLCVGLVTLMLLTTAVASHGRLTFRDREARIFIGFLLPSFMYLGLAMAVIGLIVGGVALPPRAGLALTVLIVATVTTGYWRRTQAPRWFLDWSMQGVTAKSAARSLTKEYVKAVRSSRELKAARPVRGNLPRRLFDGLRAAVRQG